MVFLLFQFVPTASCPFKEHHQEEWDSIFFFTHSLLLVYLQKPFLLLFIFLTRFNSRWASCFLMPSLHAQGASLYFPQVTWSYFHLLYSSFLCWRSLMQTDIMTPLLLSLLIYFNISLIYLCWYIWYASFSVMDGMSYSWAWRRWSLKIKTDWYH